MDDTDTYVCRPHAPGEIAGALTGATLTGARRIGKSMWCETDRGVRLGLHLGMAGHILIDEEPTKPLWARFTLHLADGGNLVLYDRRRLGRAVLDPDLSHLGPDAARISRDAFRARVGRGDAPLKARIMDQSVIAGVGNLLADEALWRARLDPRRPAGDLDDDELDRLRVQIRATTRDAMRHGGVHTGKVIPYRNPGERCPRCRGEMVRATIGGRTTWWCSAEQA